MPLDQMNELSKLGEDHQDPRENLAPLEGQYFGDEEEVEEEEEGALSSSSSSLSSSLSVLFPNCPEEVDAAEIPSNPQSPDDACLVPPAMAPPPWSQSEDEGSSIQDEGGPSSSENSKDAIHSKMVQLVMFLLLKYREKEPVTKAEMLSCVIREHQDHFCEIFQLASECLQLVFGVDVKEVDPSDHRYVLDTTLGLTYDDKANDKGNMPKTGLLVTLLCLILLDGDRIPEEEVWKTLSSMGVYDGKEHSVFGEPRELITKIWVQEEYLVYRLVPDSSPACYEFLWGPRAFTETTKLKVMEYLLKVNKKNPIPFLSLFGGPDSDDEEEF